MLWGVRPDPDNCSEVKHFPAPTNTDQLRSFVAWAGYYRKFIKDLSKIAKPLSDLLTPTSNKKCSRQTDQAWKWDQDHQPTFEKI